MSTYPLSDLLRLWQRGHLNVEQLVGHLLQHILKLEERLRRLEGENRQVDPLEE